MSLSPNDTLPQASPPAHRRGQRRRAATGAAQAKRVAWGKQWAEIDKGIAAKLERERE